MRSLSPVKTWYLKVNPTWCRSVQKRACQATSTALESFNVPPFFFSFFCFAFHSVSRFLSNLHPSTNTFFDFFCLLLLLLLFFYDFAKLGGFCEPAVVTPPHLMPSLVIVLNNKRRHSLQTIQFFFFFCGKDVLLDCPACWTCMVCFFSFICLRFFCLFFFPPVG